MIKVGIVGGTGYTGVELLRLLSAHRQAKLVAITSRGERGTRVADMFPSLRGIVDPTFTAPEETRLTECDVVFFATPHGIAMSHARELLDANVKIIDLAADFRLKDTAEFEKWYGMPHACPELLQEAVYGLVEVNREAIRKARLIGLPGCYPTSVQLGLAPLLVQGKALVDESGLIADCKSGVSGAGRKAAVGSLFSESSDNFHAYGVKGHRHLPEIVQGLKALTGNTRDVNLTFVPHLTPMIRGIHSTLYARLKPDAKEMDFQTLYENHYRHDPFVDVLPAGSHPETRSVRASNYLRIAVHQPGNGDTLIVLVVEDNLVKGAAGQGVQCMNLMFGLDETTGLKQVPVLP